MKIRYLGTAAAEGVPAMFCKCPVCRGVRLAGASEFRTRSQVLIDGVLSIDFPPEAYAHSLRFGISLADLKYVLATHSHMDHFYAHDFILRGYRYGRGFDGSLAIYGNAEVGAVFSECTAREMKAEVGEGITFTELSPYGRYTIGGYTVLTLPARHSAAERAMLFYIGCNGAGYLHMYDTALPEEGIYAFLKQNGARAQVVSLDCTYGGRTGLARPRHMNAQDGMEVRKRLISAGVCNEYTKFVFTHFSHNCNPLTEEMNKLAQSYGVLAAYDGMELEVSGAGVTLCT